MNAVLALLSAGAFGGGDFLGGIATRRVGSALPVVVYSHVVGLVVVVALIPAFPGPLSGGAVAAGVVAGLVGTAGLALLYRGLAIGRMSVVAPVTAVGAAVIPLAWGLGSGERPGAVALTGALVAIVAIPLIASPARGGDARHNRLGLAEAVGAGVAFAVFFIAMDAAPGDSGVVPLVVARFVSVPVVVVASVVFIAGRSLRLPRSALIAAMASGLFDMAANGLFLAATRRGFLALVAVLASLYPAVTIGLARVLLDERLGRVQMLGLVVAGIGVVLIAAG